MGPTNEEIEALLALPVGAREALARVDGPGFSVYEGWRVQPSAYRPPLDYTMGAPDRGWIPADPTAILALACPDGRQWRMETCDDDKGEPAYRARRMGYGDTVSMKGGTARLAALRLLAAVWGGE